MYVLNLYELCLEFNVIAVPNKKLAIWSKEFPR